MLVFYQPFSELCLAMIVPKADKLRKKKGKEKKNTQKVFYMTKQL